MAPSEPQEQIHFELLPSLSGAAPRPHGNFDNLRTIAAREPILLGQDSKYTKDALHTHKKTPDFKEPGLNEAA